MRACRPRDRNGLVRVLAVDWSGKLKGAEEHLWLAGVQDGELVDLRSGLSRELLVERLVEMAREDSRMAVGLDFAFSFPRWWRAERGWTSGRRCRRRWWRRGRICWPPAPSRSGAGRDG
jgi:hypothetical protein